MKLRKSKRSGSFTSILVLTCFTAIPGLAATLTWNGGYATTGSWQNASNWGGTAWANGSDIVFGSVNLNNITSTFLAGGKTVKSLTFQAGSPAYNVRLATSGSGGTGSILTFISSNTGLTVEAGDTSSHNIGISDGSISLQGDLLVTHDGSGTLTFSRPVTGAFNLTKSGSGLLALTSGNTYSGNTTINAGKLRGVVGGGAANSQVILNDPAATFQVQITDNTKTWTCSSLTTAAAGTLEFNFGSVAASSSASPLTVSGLADFSSATPAVNVLVNAGLPPGVYPLITWDSFLGTIPETANLTISAITGGTTASLSATDNGLSLVITGTAPTIVKANNTDSLNLGSSWVGGAAPGATDVAVWNDTVTGPNTTEPGGDLTWAGLAIGNPAGPVTLNAGNTLSLGGAALAIDMTSATADLTLNCPLTLATANTWNIAASRTLTVGGQVSGDFGFTKLGDGAATLSSTANNYTGNTIVSSGTLRLGASDVIPNGANFGNIVLNGTLDLNGNSDTVNGLSGSGSVDNTVAATTSTLTVGQNGQTSTFSGILQNTVGTLNLTKVGAGTLVLGGVNTLTGSVAVQGGTLAFTKTNPLNDVSGISLAGGTTLRPDVASATLAAPITVGETGTTATISAPSVAGSGTTPVPVTLGSGITGAGDVRFNSNQTGNAYSTIILSAASDYEGATLITTTGGTNTQMFVRLGAENALPVTTVLTLDGGDGTTSDRYCQVDLKGYDQTLAGLTNIPRNNFRKQQIINSGGAATLTINNSADWVFSGRLGTTAGQTGSVGANLGLTKSGAGMLTLSGSNAYTGATTITAGTLALGASNVLADGTEVSIGDATLNIGNGAADVLGSLNVTGTATIHLGAGGALAYTAASPAWAGSLTITGAFVSGVSLRFGADASGLTPTQLAVISGPGLSDFALNSDGYLTAVSSGGFTSWIAGTFANGSIPLEQQGSDDDFDNDGISNLVEYALAGQDPTVANAAVGSFATNTLSFTKREAAVGLTYAIQESTDLGALDDWTEVTGGSYVNDPNTISYTFTPGTPAENFLRLQVTSN
jgi:autotransporter-associated beta strand protein